MTRSISRLTCVCLFAVETLCATSAFARQHSIEWAAFFGGSDTDSAEAIALDTAGNAIVAGYTYSTDFQGRSNTNHGDHDAYVLKVSPSGTFEWMTHLGGSGGDYGRDIALDSAGNAYVCGSTSSADFQGRTNSIHEDNDDAFVAKVNPSGVLQWVTYLGGSEQDTGHGITVDSVGNTFVTGKTWSDDFEGARNKFHGFPADAFVAEINPSGSLQWMIYLGGSSYERGRACILDGAGNLIVIGDTLSTDFDGAINSNHGPYDAFVVKMDLFGSIQWMTYLGGESFDFADGIVIDRAGNMLIAGSTQSFEFEGRTNSYHRGIGDAFLVRVSPQGALDWMTYIGGAGSDWCDGVALDPAGNALVIGGTNVTNFQWPVSPYWTEDADAFIVSMSPSGTLQWSAFYGGDDHDVPQGIVCDPIGNAFVTGRTASYSTIHSHYEYGDLDAFVLKLRLPNR